MSRYLPLRLLMAVLVMWLLTQLFTGCSARPVEVPELPKPIKVECLRETIEQDHPADFRDPPSFDGLADEEQDRAMLSLFVGDFQQYTALRETALRCAE